MTYYGAKDLAESFRTVRKNTIVVAEEIPENQYGFRAAPETRTVAQTLYHVAAMPGVQQQIHAIERRSTLEGFDFPAVIRRLIAEEQTPRTKAQLIALLRRTLMKAGKMVREGQALSGSLTSTGVFPPLAIDMIEVGESTGALPVMLTSVAEFYEEEVNLKLSAMVSLIEPAILIFMGILVAFILISLYLPIFSFSITGAAGH